VVRSTPRRPGRCAMPTFTRTLARTLCRPAFCRVPAFALRFARRFLPRTARQ
jgi:NAD dependent epimerase/dehydratase family enzyme